MRTLELLEHALVTAERMGYRVRHEWLGGTGGGLCRYAGRRWIFVDLALNVDEQLGQVVEALKCDPGIHLQPVHGDLSTLLNTS
jgi:hypothetical protein